MKDFSKLDEAIVETIKGGKHRYIEIWTAVALLAAPHVTRSGGEDRVVDRRLQALRKAGWITCKGQRWELAEGTL